MNVDCVRVVDGNDGHVGDGFTLSWTLSSRCTLDFQSKPSCQKCVFPVLSVEGLNFTV